MRFAAVFVLAPLAGLAVSRPFPEKPLAPAGDEPPAEVKSSAKLPATHAEMGRHLDSLRPQLVAMNQDVWGYAELGLEEYRSAGRLIKMLQKAAERVRERDSGMPTAFVAECGKGKPIISILAEYDALPEL